MTYTPLGFTQIDSKYTPLDPIPSVNGTKEGLELQSLFNQFVYFTEVEPITIAPLPEGDSVVISLAASTNYPAINSQIKLKLDINRTLPLASTIVVRLLSPVPTEYENQQAIILQTQPQQRQQLEVSFSVGGTLALLQLVAHPLEDTLVPPLEITQAQYNQLSYRSNLVTLFVQDRIVNSAEQTVPQGVVQSNPLLDAVPTITESLLRTIVIDQVLDLAPTNPQPHGSHGVGIYKDVGIPSPLNSSMHKKVPSESLRRLLGMAVDQLKRLEGWADKVLHKAHSHKSSAPNSELNLLLNLLPDEIKEAVERYSEFLDESGKYATSVAQTYTPDYAQGNTLVKSHAIEQHNVGQFRTQTSSVFDVNSPSINLAAQQHVTQARFEHHVGDLYQGSHLHYFVRAEDKLTQMSANDITYASNTLTEYSANSQRITGAKVQYQDAEFDQVGQSGNTPIHPTNTKVEDVNSYGNSTKLVHKDYNLVTSVGEIVLNSGTHTHIHAKQGDLKLSATQAVRVDSGTTFTLKAAQNLQVNSSQKLLMSGSDINLAASNNVLIKGNLVLINSGGSVTVPQASNPKVVTVEPKTFQPLQDPVPYDKNNPISPGPVGQNIPNTPEPNQTLGGDSKLGSFLTGQS